MIKRFCRWVLADELVRGRQRIEVLEVVGKRLAKRIEVPHLLDDGTDQYDNLQCLSDLAVFSNKMNYFPPGSYSINSSIVMSDETTG